MQRQAPVSNIMTQSLQSCTSIYSQIKTAIISELLTQIRHVTLILLQFIAARATRSHDCWSVSATLMTGLITMRVATNVTSRNHGDHHHLFPAYFIGNENLNIRKKVPPTMCIQKKVKAVYCPVSYILHGP